MPCSLPPEHISSPPPPQHYSVLFIFTKLFVLIRTYFVLYASYPLCTLSPLPLYAFPLLATTHLSSHRTFFSPLAEVILPYFCPHSLWWRYYCVDLGFSWVFCKVPGGRASFCLLSHIQHRVRYLVHSRCNKHFFSVIELIVIRCSASRSSTLFLPALFSPVL